MELIIPVSPLNYFSLIHCPGIKDVQTTNTRLKPGLIELQGTFIVYPSCLSKKKKLHWSSVSKTTDSQGIANGSMTCTDKLELFLDLLILRRITYSSNPVPMISIKYISASNLSPQTFRSLCSEEVSGEPSF